MRSWDEIKEVLACCTYPGFEFEMKVVEGGDITTAYMQVRCREGVDTTTGGAADWKGRKWQLSRYMTDSEIVVTAWAAVQRALLHEAAEMFKFRDAAIFDRHINVHGLVELVKGPDALDGRPDGMTG